MTETVAVSVNGKSATWTDGEFFGDPYLVSEALRSVAAEHQYQYHGVAVMCADDNALGALAALSVTSPGRTVVKEAPGKVLAYVFNRYDGDIPDRTMTELNIDDSLTNPADEDA
jgi:hypothetical protein